MFWISFYFLKFKEFQINGMYLFNFFINNEGATEIVPEVEAELRKFAMETVQNAKSICAAHWVCNQSFKHWFIWLICLCSSKDRTMDYLHY